MQAGLLKFIAAAGFATLTLLATALLAGLINVMFNWSDGTGTGILVLINVLTFFYALRAALPRLSLARGLMVCAVGLMTIPVQAILIVYLGFVDITGPPGQAGLASITERLNIWMTSGSIAFWAAGISVTIAPVMFIFGWAFATKGPNA